MTAPAGTRYVMAPQWMFRSGVSGAAVLTWGALASRGRWDDEAGGYVDIWPSVDTVAADTELSESTVRRSIRELITRGLLEVEQRRTGRRQATNRYRALVGRPPYHNGRDEASQPVTSDTLTSSQPVTSDGSGALQPVTSDRHALQPVTGDTLTSSQPVTSDGTAADSTEIDAPRCPVSEVVSLSDLLPEEEPLLLPVVPRVPSQTQVQNQPQPDDAAAGPPLPLVGAPLNLIENPPVADGPTPVTPGVALTAPPTREDQIAPTLVGIHREMAEAYATAGIEITPDEIRELHHALRHSPKVSNVYRAWRWYTHDRSRLEAVLRRLRQRMLRAAYAEGRGEPCPHGEPGGAVTVYADGKQRLIACPLCRLGAAAAQEEAARSGPADCVVTTWAKAADMSRPANRSHLGLILRQAERLLASGVDVDTLVTIAGEAGKRNADLVSYADRVLNYAAAQEATNA